jgi:hypothetical protein
MLFDNRPKPTSGTNRPSRCRNRQPAPHLNRPKGGLVLRCCLRCRVLTANRGGVCVGCLGRVLPVPVRRE